MIARDPRIPEWQAKCASGTITAEEMAEVVEYLRAGREKAASIAAAAKAAKLAAKAAAKPPRKTKAVGAEGPSSFVADFKQQMQSHSTQPSKEPTP